MGDTSVNGVDNDTQFGLTLTYMITNRVGLELLAAIPFEHDVCLDALSADIASS
ncbi:MAG: outer membrane protein [Pseudohongiellaceae bacterium]